MYRLMDIKEVKDTYSVDAVNCLEKPVGVMLNSYNPLYRNLYLLMHKMVQSYNFEYYSEKLFRSKNTMGRTCDILQRELGIYLNRVELMDDFFDFINKQLWKNNPVIVPVNLRELYYSSFYKKSDWIHSFLLYGYNEANNLYEIFDSTQRHEEGGLSLYKFVVPSDVLFEMYQSFNNNIYNESIFYLDSEKVPLEFNLKDKLKNILNIFCYKRSSEPYVEKEVIEQILKEGTVNQRLIKRIMKTYHYKKVLYEEMLFLFETLNFDCESLDVFKKIKEELLDVWSKINGKIVYYLYKKKIDLIEMDTSKAFFLEKDMHECVKKILSYIENDICVNECEVSRIRCINNEDDIITQSQDGVFEFLFDNDKIYNNWFQDCAPRVIFDNVKKYGDFMLSAKITLEEYMEGSSFVTGIYLYDDAGNSYIWGINSGVSILFEHTRVNNAVMEYDNCSNEVRLKVVIKDNKLFLAFKLLGNAEYHETYFNLENKIVAIGICCKTWGEAQKLKIKVNEVEIS